MIKPWFRRRRRRSQPADRSLRVDRRHRRPAFERVEDRWMLSGPAGETGTYEGFIDLGHVFLFGTAATPTTIGSHSYVIELASEADAIVYCDSDATGHGLKAPVITQPDGPPLTRELKLDYTGSVFNRLSSSPPSGPVAVWGGSSGSVSVPGQARVEPIRANWTTQGGGLSLGFSGPALPADVGHDIEPIRLPADGTSPGAPEARLIDVAPVLDEPVGLASYQLVHRQDGSARVGKRSDRAAWADAEQGRSAGESRDPARAVELAASWGGRAWGDVSPGHARPVSLRDSPFGPIKGARGLSRAFELGTSGDGILAASSGGVPGALRLDPSARQPDHASYDQPSPGAQPLREVPLALSDRTLASVADSADAAHEAVFAELARPLGDALLNAVYVENKRVTELIPFLAVAALTHHLARRPWDGPVNDRTGVAYPRRRHPTTPSRRGSLARCSG